MYSWSLCRAPLECDGLPSLFKRCGIPLALQPPAGRARKRWPAANNQRQVSAAVFPTLPLSGGRRWQETAYYGRGILAVLAEHPYLCMLFCRFLQPVGGAVLPIGTHHSGKACGKRGENRVLRSFGCRIYRKRKGGKNPAEIDARGRCRIEVGRLRDSKAENRRNTDPSWICTNVIWSRIIRGIRPYSHAIRGIRAKLFMETVIIHIY